MSDTRDTRDVVRLEIEELEAIRQEMERQVEAQTPRWNADPEEVQRSVARLVLALVEFLRRLMERQAIRRMEATPSPPRRSKLGGPLKLETRPSKTWPGARLGAQRINMDS